ncbi:MAG: hydroxyacid dehydrogenase [Fluviicola sp.]|jgi:D-lactate dehydrogenase|uniref:2-hydroxyacid dehydrogenase n=1 Tax=Fluviicola sp. TaxID=1917219 RepID=UPI0026095071|nr:2-hydroxyacid dehydrogenase [Fluviicola sp.]MDF3026578.1 hydroxyacid dehydrogenase [Fluviicola sp.]
MKMILYSFHAYEQPYFEKFKSKEHQLLFSDQVLSDKTASLSKGFDTVSLFANDDASAPVLELLHRNGIRFITLRSAGYNHVDLNKAKQLGMRVARVPAYSPFSVAEHAVMLMLALNRKVIQSHSRVIQQNFSLNGLTGFDMNGKTVGIIGTGKIGSTIARILHGFGCRLLAFDPVQNEEIKQRYQVMYTDRETLYRSSDIITLHLPLNEETHYFIDRTDIAQMKAGVMLINTARGGLVNTNEVIEGIKSGQIGYFGMDVYENEHDLFFEDHSQDILQDDILARLMSFRNALITGHQGFLTDTALKNICETTMYNLDCFAKGITSENELS